MKRNVTVEQTICDVCQTREASYSECLGCGINICYECRKTSAVKYSHGVNFSGSGDGLYCLPCDNRLRVSSDALHAAYRAVRSLRNEQNGWYQTFKARQEEAEARVKNLRDARAQP